MTPVNKTDSCPFADNQTTAQSASCGCNALLHIVLLKCGFVVFRQWCRWLKKSLWTGQSWWCIGRSQAARCRTLTGGMLERTENSHGSSVVW